MAKIRKILCKQYVSTEKNLSPQTFYGCFVNFSDCSHYPC